MGVTRQRLEARGTRYVKGKLPKKINKFAKVILMLCVGVFFSIPFVTLAVGFKEYDPLEKVMDSVKKAQMEEKRETRPQIEKENIAENVDPETVDPLKRVEKVAPIEKIISLKNPEEKISKTKASQGVGEKASKYSNFLSGYPMAAMLPALSRQESSIATFLVAIAKKESDWGKHAPQKDGEDCYNYWGYKGSLNLTDSGYSCFDSPEQAVSVVGGRIGELIGKNIDTPAKMVVWKCGSSCRGHDPGSVEKWISDVDTYYRKLSS